jgi:FkbM family methyltransferase
MGGRVACIDIGFAGGSRKFWCFDNPSSINTSGDVISGKSYPIFECLGPVRRIADIGANVGAAAVYFSLHYPQAEIRAFEPGAAAHDLLCRNAEGTRIRPFPLGLFDRDMETTLLAGAFDTVTASIQANSQTGTGGEKIRLREARAALADFAPMDILKIDTEGCERHILASLGEMALAAKAVYLEFHSEDDRRGFDALFAATHTLAAARVLAPHRGELCYVARNCWPDYERDAVRVASCLT